MPEPGPATIGAASTAPMPSAALSTPYASPPTENTSSAKTTTSEKIGWPKRPSATTAR